MMQYHDKVCLLEEASKKVLEAVENILQAEDNITNEDEDNVLNGLAERQNTVEFSDITENLRNKDCDSLERMVNDMNADQLNVFRKVKEHLLHEQEHISSKCNCDQLNSLLMMISGVGGTGKSYVIKALKLLVLEDFSGDAAVCAPTGLAAHNIGGITIHRLLHLPVEHGKTAVYQPLGDEVLGVLRKTLQNIRLLVIDEVSMVSNIVFLHINLRLQEIFEESKTFGGVNVIFLGDFLQLPPVHEAPVFKVLSNDKVSAIVGSLGSFNAWKMVTYEELTVNVRQKADPTYADMLNRIRVGQFNGDDIECLSSKKIALKSSKESMISLIGDFYENLSKQGSHPVCIFPLKAMCREFSDVMVKRNENVVVEIKALDTLDCATVSKNALRKKLNTLADDDSRTAGLQNNLRLCKGARVMLRKNLDQMKGLVNGAMGTLQNILFSNSVASKLVIRFDHSGESIEIERINVKFQVFQNAFVHRKQFPISLAYAITIHKSQGLSLDCVIADLGNTTFGPGMIYVALSRVKTLDGLHLLNFDPSKVIASRDAIQEYNRLRSLFRPDLPSINQATVKCNSIPDINWVQHKNLMQQSLPTVRPSVSIIQHHTFENISKVNCYANSAIQCLLVLSDIKQYLITSEIDENIVSREVHKILNSMTSADASILSTFNLRMSLGEPFSLEEQQDVCQFIERLLMAMNCNHLVNFRKTTTIHCDHCKNTTSSESSDTIFYIPLTGVTDSITFQELWKMENMWMSITDGQCSKCKIGGKLKIKQEIDQTSNIFILSLIPKFVNGIKCHPKITGLNTKGFKIGTNTYKVSGCIQHYGNSPQSGHYTATIRASNLKDWMLLNDEVSEVKKRFISGLQNVNVLFFERLGN